MKSFLIFQMVSFVKGILVLKQSHDNEAAIGVAKISLDLEV